MVTQAPRLLVAAGEMVIDSLGSVAPGPYTKIALIPSGDSVTVVVETTRSQDAGRSDSEMPAEAVATFLTQVVYEMRRSRRPENRPTSASAGRGMVNLPLEEMHFVSTADLAAGWVRTLASRIAHWARSGIDIGSAKHSVS